MCIRDRVDDITILPNLSENEQLIFIDSLIPNNAILFFEDYQTIRQRLQFHFNRSEEIYEKHIGLSIDEVEPAKKYFSADKLDQMVQKYHYIKSDLVKIPEMETINVNFKPHPDFNGRIKLFLEFLRKQSELARPPIIYLQTMNTNQANRFRDIIEEEEIVFNGIIEIGSLHLSLIHI